MADSPSKLEDAETGDKQSPENEGIMEHGGEGAFADFEVKEQDRWLPIANVARIMKLALPENAKIAKEAKECMQECVSEFISFITSEASEKCQQEKRKTVNGEDILFAMTSLGFENYAEALKIYLARYRELMQSRGDQNQGRPNSGGYEGPPINPGAPGATGTSTVTGTINSTAPGPLPPPYTGQPDPAAASLLPGAESTPYGGVYAPSATHNGTGEGY